MISDIVSAINGKVKFCVQFSGHSYFIDKLNEDGTTFIDAVDGKPGELRNLENSTITTFSTLTIPTQNQINEIRNNNFSFFEENKNNIEESNEIFDNYVAQAKDYLKAFTVDSEEFVKRSLIDNRTAELEIFKILKSDRAFRISGANNTTTSQNRYVRTLYYKLVDEKLSQALSDIDANIEEINDEDFTKEANQIKADLEKNVEDFKMHMTGTEYRNLFNQWPTLLNPSPFANVQNV